MSDALSYLLEDTQRYLLIINRSTVNPDTGETQDASITLSENDPPALGSPLDPRIIHSRHAIIVMVQKDGGVAKVDLTGRRWEIWIKSALLREKLRTFNKKLLANARSRLLTVDSALLIASFPVWGPILLFFAWSFSNRKSRHEVWSATSNRNMPWPIWIKHFQSFTAGIWIILIAISLGIWIIVLMGGGLRIWPSKLSQHSFQRAVYQIRSNFALPQNLNSPLFSAVAGAIAGAIVAYILTRYFG